MRLYISKIIRTFYNDRIPSTCYAYQWLPQSVIQVCDCATFCKFPPKGNTGIPIVAYNHNTSETSRYTTRRPIRPPYIP